MVWKSRVCSPESDRNIHTLTHTHTHTHTHTLTHSLTHTHTHSHTTTGRHQAVRCMDSREVTQGDKQTLLDLLLRVIREGEREKLNTREKSAHSRPIEIVLRDVSIKDRFIKHFTGPVKFPSECRMHFHRIYHNTRDCARPAFYKRCARLLMRLAMSPLCAQP
ncbi:ALK and LTK ligand 1 isoform X2 [Pangasianodon hypophthalmus]|uniref:ALK and LTK ligand 1 isoform X2 n=1 Tax=Pangasianodon hypophthalmus TaxID=310915 RepID=UPI000EFDF348|nr:ALK and LTK ligand 1 isoform X2 [Pangasianodon hypophthalmus]